MTIGQILAWKQALEDLDEANDDSTLHGLIDLLPPSAQAPRHRPTAVGPGSYPPALDKARKALDSFTGVSASNVEGYQVLDFFSGCGGMSLGFAAYANAHGGIRSFTGIDLDPWSSATYAANLGRSLRLDVRELAATPTQIGDILRDLSGYEVGLPTILIGCPPCQGFSAHAKKRRTYTDPRNSLGHDFARIAVALAPPIIVLENVPEMLSPPYSPYWEAIRTTFEDAGYVVKAQVFNLASFGVPQQRNRVLMIASRGDFIMPQPLYDAPGFRTVRDAISDLPPIQPGEVHPHDPMHRTARHKPSTIDVIRRVPADGGNRPRGVGPPCLDRVKGFYDVYGRLAWDRPSITVTHYSRSPACGRFTHPEQHRGLSAREAARLQSFPDGYDFQGPFDDVFRQIGEAVPPMFGCSVAAWVFSALGAGIAASLVKDSR